MKGFVGMFYFQVTGETCIVNIYKTACTGTSRQDMFEIKAKLPFQAEAKPAPLSGQKGQFSVRSWPAVPWRPPEAPD